MADITKTPEQQSCGPGQGLPLLLLMFGILLSGLGVGLDHMQLGAFGSGLMTAVLLNNPDLAPSVRHKADLLVRKHGGKLMLGSSAVALLAAFLPSLISK